MHSHTAFYLSFSPPVTLPLSIVLACQTNLFASIASGLLLLCPDSTTFSHFLVPELFSNDTKLVGIKRFMCLIGISWRKLKKLAVRGEEK